jgi:thiamine biosynthesis lipoprotein
MNGAPRCLLLQAPILLALSSAATGAAVTAAGACMPAGPCEYTQIHMGLPVRIVLHADEQTAGDAARAAFDRIAALDAMMSDYRPDSELRRVELGAGEPVAVSPELFRTLARARDVACATDGAFDPSVGALVALWRLARTTGALPVAAALDDARSRTGWRRIHLDAARQTVRIPRGMRLDLGGIAKGSILQQALITLRAQGVSRALVEAGGDIVVGDPPPGSDGWRIDAAGSQPAFQAQARRLRNAAIATSGPTAQFVEIAGVRYSHIIDPRTGLGVTTPVVARVIAADAATADALATALTILGREALPRIRGRFPGVSMDVAARGL